MARDDHDSSGPEAVARIQLQLGTIYSWGLSFDFVS